MTDGASRASSRRNALVFITITVAIDATGIGLLAPIMPTLIERLTGQGLAAAAIYGGWLTALFSLVQFFAQPVLGNLSDRFGRRPVLLISLFAFALNYLLMGFAPSILWLFVAQGLAGIFGATLSTAGAFIADVSDARHRARNFGLIGAAFGVGLVIGPMIGGLLVGFGARVPFFTAAGLALANVCYGLLILPESLGLEHRRPFFLRRANPAGALAQMRRRPLVFALLQVMLLMQIAGVTLPATWPYFTMQKFGWSAREVGYSLGLYGMLNIVIQGWLIGRIVGSLGNRRTVYFGLTLTLAGYLGFAFADRSWLLCLSILPTAIGFITGPALSSIMSAEVAADAQGELQGAIASLNSLAATIAPLVMTRLFSAFSAPAAALYFPGAPYLAVAVLVSAAFALLVRALRGARTALAT
jgi:DHA1 family tetracycline resistance protein-like MFS transporter